MISRDELRLTALNKEILTENFRIWGKEAIGNLKWHRANGTKVFIGDEPRSTGDHYVYMGHG